MGTLAAPKLGKEARNEYVGIDGSRDARVTTSSRKLNLIKLTSSRFEENN